MHPEQKGDEIYLGDESHVFNFCHWETKRFGNPYKKRRPVFVKKEEVERQLERIKNTLNNTRDNVLIDILTKQVRFYKKILKVSH